MKKNVLAISTLVVLGAVAWAGYYFNFNIEQTSANPDYICIKSVAGESCRISSCTDWGTDGKRTCSWKRTTEVWYYHTRTSCESGYSVAINWKTATDDSASTYAPSTTLDAEGLAATTTHPSSWRHGSDYIYSSEDCTIVEEDTVPPTWKIDSIWTSIN